MNRFEQKTVLVTGGTSGSGGGLLGGLNINANATASGSATANTGVGGLLKGLTGQ